MPSAQALLFPDPTPLVDRLGPDFFRQLPTSPGIYKMRNATGQLLYVGKAKNLRQRLRHYRVANPDRLAARHLRLLRSVERIDIELCPNESSALVREAELLLVERPKYNRAGTWRPQPRYLAWRPETTQLHLRVLADVEPGWFLHGPWGATASSLHGIISRLFWISCHPHLGYQGLPPGWTHGRRNTETSLSTGEQTPLHLNQLESLLRGDIVAFSQWMRTRLPVYAHIVELGLLQADLDQLADLQPALAAKALTAPHPTGT
jgi:GIY-YIG catalytic domain